MAQSSIEGTVSKVERAWAAPVVLARPEVHSGCSLSQALPGARLIEELLLTISHGSLTKYSVHRRRAMAWRTDAGKSSFIPKMSTAGREKYMST